MSPEIACGITIIIGIGKEIIWDKWIGRGAPEVLDSVMTTIGALTVLFYEKNDCVEYQGK